MAETTETNPAIEEGPAADEPRQVELDEPLPDVLTKLSKPGVLARLENAARRGKLAGFTTGDPEGICTVAAFGDPFDKKLVVIAESESDGRTRLRWRMRLSPRMPALLLVVLAFSVFPGEPFTDSLLKTYFRWYDDWVQAGLRTWYWYVPLTVIPIPFVWRAVMRRTHRTTWDSAHAAVEKIAGFVAGERVTPRLKAPR